MEKIIEDNVLEITNDDEYLIFKLDKKKDNYETFDLICDDYGLVRLNNSDLFFFVNKYINEQFYCIFVDEEDYYLTDIDKLTYGVDSSSFDNEEDEYIGEKLKFNLNKN